MQLTATPPKPASPVLPNGMTAPGPVRQGIAGALRESGDGFDHATHYVGVAVDKGSIYPVESVYAVTGAADKATRKVGILNRIVKPVGAVAGYLAAVEGMIVGSVVRSPGAVVKDAANAAADAIDGQQTSAGQFGGGVLLPIPAAG